MEFEEIQGVRLPKIGLGTWRLKGGACRRAVETALELGYRHLDTAQAYGNEREVGAALAAAPVEREEVFLTTKLDFRNRRAAAVHQSVRESLDRLGVDAIDLLLIHQPNPLVSLEETIRAMNELQDDGLVEHVGVSNFDVDRLDAARAASESPIFTDQVQFHPFKDQSSLLRYCHRHDVVVTAYSPLAHGGAMADERLAEIGRKYQKSPAQVALRWAIQHDGVVAIPKATSREHLAANLDVFDFRLSDAEMRSIARPSTLRTVSLLARSRLPFGL